MREADHGIECNASHNMMERCRQQNGRCPPDERQRPPACVSYLRPAEASQSAATFEASGLLGSLSLVSRSISTSVVSLADTALSACLTSSLAFELLISGKTFWAAKLFFGSSSTTKLFALIVGSVVKMSAA